MGSKSAPRPPDYTGAAVAQGESAENVNLQQTYANRPTQNTPVGSSTWAASRGIDPATGKAVTKWAQDLNLSPEQMEIFRTQERIARDRSTLAEGLIGTTKEQLAKPLDWEGLPETGATPGVPTYGGNLRDFGVGADPNAAPPPLPEGAKRYDELGEFGAGPDIGALSPTGGPLDTTMGDLGPAGAQVSGDIGDIGATGRALRSEGIQGQLDFTGLNDVQAGGGYQDRFGNTQFDRAMSLEGPRMERSMTQLDTSLRNQGLSPGTPAYDNAMKDLRDQQGERIGRISADALGRGTAEQQAQFARELQQRQQGVTETGLSGDFANLAQQQGFGQQQSVSQFAESQRASRAQESAQRQQMALASSSQAEQLRAARAGERAQQFGMDQAGADTAEAQRAARLGEQGAVSDAATQLREGQYGEYQDITEAQSAAAQGEFDRGQTAAEYADAQRKQQVSEGLATGGQSFDQELQAANYQNQLRQQKIAEEAQRRGISINEMNALLSGQQVSGTPQMPSFMGAEKADAVNYLGAATAQGNYDASIYGTQMGLYGDALSAAGTAMPSDIRLKTNIKRLNVIAGLDFVSWTWNGLLGLTGKSCGFIAQQVQALFPQYVGEIDGYLAIDYDGLLTEIGA